ncbi:two-component sensor histidine kinase [Dinghuibacter silviterrae]|uniref:histidine kinase n=2 Tax=Dinghuibacter silviterrae TaxID=1539049 RepID=A0A4R8DFI6_9BACT|nr:two-component sensor histidine kinase [Dinghuibacter silviterrae]
MLLVYPSVNGQQLNGKAGQRTMLELGAAAITVTTQGRVLLDSTLILVSQYHGVSRSSVITEGFDDDFCARYAGWVRTGNVDSIIKVLPGLGGDIQTRVRILLGAWYAYQPGAEHYRMAITELTMAQHEKGIEWAAQAYCLLMKAYYMLGDTARGNAWYLSFLHHPEFSNLAALQAKVRKYAGVFCPFRPGTTGFRLQCLSEALSRYQALKDTGNQVNTLMDIAYLRFAGGDPVGSQQAARQALSLEKAWGFPYTQYTYDLLAFLKIFASQYSEALPLAMECVKATEATHDRLYSAHAYLRVADVVQQLEDVTAATGWYKQALKAAIGTRRDEDLYEVLENLGAKNISLDLSPGAVHTVEDMIAQYPPGSRNESQLAFEALGSAFESARDYPKAREYFMRAWQLEGEASKTRGGMTNTYLIRRLGRINLTLEDWEGSRKFLMMLLSPALAGKVDQEDLSHAYYGMYRVDSACGDFKDAAHWLVQYSDLEDKENFQAQARQLIDMNVKYETLQKEKRLQELRTQKQLYIAGFVFLGFVIVMVYVRYRNNKRTNRQLQALNRQQTVLLEEKEWLVREIHHRVKNNLQIITSLLMSQSEFLTDKNAVNVILESQHRVEAMSLIHQKLYNSRNLSSIDMPDYIGELVDYLRDSFVLSQKVVFDLDIERISLDVSKAIPVGLILNEAITNAFKYAFPHGADDRISIRLFSEGEKTILRVADNGRGLPEDFDAAGSGTFGMTLIRGMAEDLEATIDISGHHGTVIRVSWQTLFRKF